MIRAKGIDTAPGDLPNFADMAKTDLAQEKTEVCDALREHASNQMDLQRQSDRIKNDIRNLPDTKGSQIKESYGIPHWGNWSTNCDWRNQP